MAWIATYSCRDKVLKLLGFGSYAEYLQSDLWKSIKLRIYNHVGRNCRLCGGRATEVHHVRYLKTILTGQTKSPRKFRECLVPLCKGCHYSVEFDNAGVKRTLHASQQAYRELDKSRKASMRILKGIPDVAPSRKCRCGNISSKNSRMCKRCRLRKTRSHSPK